MRHTLCLTGLALLTALLSAGCGGESDRTDPPDPRGGLVGRDHKHDRKRPGVHGGLVEKIKPLYYHAEVVFAKDGTVTLYTLGGDWRTVLEVDEQALTARLQAEGSEAPVPVPLRPSPQDGDARGKTSRFVARLPKELEGQEVVGTVENLRIAGERFSFAVRSKPHEPVPAMPVKVVDEDERKLYLTPGGKYTEADIRANGNKTASQRYANFHSAHDLDPKVGDTLCPVTQTKGNAKCVWVVGGKSYQFCCPPCIDEFVRLAKEDPDKIKTPEEYVKKAGQKPKN